MFRAMKDLLFGPGGKAPPPAKAARPEASPPPAAPAAVASAPGCWRLSDPVFPLHIYEVGGNRRGETSLTLNELCTGMAVFGATGSGKTSGTADHLAHALLRYGCGGLVLCAKPDEADAWRERAARAGRSGDLIVFDRSAAHRFNPLQFEADLFRDAEHGFTENLLQILRELCETGGAAQGEDPFWGQSRDRLFANTLDLMQLAGEAISFSSLHAAILSFARPAAAEAFLERARARAEGLSESRRRDLALTESYFRSEWPLLPERTMESIKTMATGAVEPFARGVIREIFSTTSTVTPEACGAEGKVIVLDLPAVTLTAGKAAAVCFKHMFQKWAERRPKEGDATRPVFLFADECQYFATPRDAVFQSTARSSRVITVYLTQTAGSLNFFGSGQAKQHRDMLLGNLITRVFHRNTDPETNTWAAELAGKDMIERISRSTGGSRQQEGNQTSGINYGRTVSEQYDWLLKPVTFTRLLSGGEVSDGIVTAILCPGTHRRFFGRAPFAEIGFRQGKF